MEAQDIFGLDFDFDEFEKYGRDDFSSDEEEDEYEEEDTEDGAVRRQKKKSTKKTIYEVGASVVDCRLHKLIFGVAKRPDLDG